MASQNRLSTLLAKIKMATKHGVESVLWRAGLDVTIRRTKGQHRTRSARDHQWPSELSPNTVLDIGAHVGAHTEVFRAVFPSAQVFAFEPVADVYASLVRRFEGDDRVVAYNIALGGADGEATLHQSAAPETSSLLAMSETHKETYPHTAETWETTVGVRTLDSLRSELALVPPVLAKIDVQGGELAVLDGARDTLADIAIVIIETSFAELYAGQPLFDAVYERLTAAGFHYAGSFNQLVHPLSRRVLQQDAIFLRDDLDPNH